MKVTNPTQIESNSIPWLFKMAWRDSRKNRSRLLLFISSVVLGIAALVAVYSFRDNLKRDIEGQAKILTGADLIIESNKPVSNKAKALLDQLGDEKATERSFVSMVYFSKNEGSRLVQIRALEGNYPFYGTIETKPAQAAKDFRKTRKALVDQTLMLQFNVKNGDSIKVGGLTFVIEGTLIKAPGQTGITSTIAPIVYIPLKYLEQTGLTKIGSRIQYKYYYKYNNPAQVEPLVKKIQPQLDQVGLNAETIETTKEDTGSAFKNVNRFLALSGFVALLLGCIGVGSAIHVYISEKLNTIATLRCLGVKARDAFLIYLIQISAIGFIGAVAGAIIGTFIQFLLPTVLKEFIPVEMTTQVSWPSILQGILLGMLISILFALPALLSVRKISPLNALRLSFDEAKEKADAAKWLVYVFIFIFILVFTKLQMQNWIEAFVFTGSIVIAFVLLFLISKLLMGLVKKMMSPKFGYIWRQGFANLYRPNNQTLMLTVSIGLSTTFICTLFFVQGLLMNKLTLSSGPNQPNMVLFDIQSNQKDDVASLTKKNNLPVLNEVPIVTVRIAEINGKTAANVDTLGPSKRAFSNEIRVTFQKKLTVAEKIVEGTWTGKVNYPEETVPISLEKGYARRIHVDVGDIIVFNVQGVRLPTVVGSLREVDWNRMQTNFRVVFPSGVIDEAPKFHVLLTHVASNTVSAKFQAAVVRHFPNVSIIDLALVLKVLDEVLSKIGFVIQFMAAFSMLTGWIVLLSAVLTSKTQRLKENILLRTLGASKKQILRITAIEYLFLGAVATGAGIILALCASWAMAVYSFDTPFSPPLFPIFALFFLICFAIVLTGVFSNRKILNRPPLSILSN